MMIDGLPLLLPDFFWNDPVNTNYSTESLEMPDWDAVLVQDYAFYWKTEDGEIRVIKAMDALDKPPDCYAVFTRDVSRETVLEYWEYLDGSFGISSLNTPESKGPLKLMYNYVDSIFVLAWKNGTAGIYMLKKPACFLPDWVLACEN